MSRVVLSRQALDELRAIVDVREQEPMARHTTFKIGGPADWYAVVRSAEELAAVVGLAYRRGVPVFVLSGGSNVLVSDRGIRGLVIDNRAQTVRVLERSEERVLVEAESGTPMATLARRTAKEGLAGLEWAIGIPGTIGGVVVFNAGAHGADIDTALVEIELVGPTGEVAWMSRESLGLGYRESAFTRAVAGGKPLGIITRARLALRAGNRAEIETRMQSFNDHRKATQPAKASAGSVFKNPAGDSAGRLIEAAGLKGFQRGNAQISELHANFIVNLGKASAEDVRTLIELAQDAVQTQFGVTLHPEVQLVGDWPRRDWER